MLRLVWLVEKNLQGLCGKRFHSLTLLTGRPRTAVMLTAHFQEVQGFVKNMKN